MFLTTMSSYHLISRMISSTRALQMHPLTVTQKFRIHHPIRTIPIRIHRPIQTVHKISFNKFFVLYLNNHKGFAASRLWKLIKLKLECFMPKRKS